MPDLPTGTLTSLFTDIESGHCPQVIRAHNPLLTAGHAVKWYNQARRAFCMQIDLTPTEAARLDAAARRAGLTPSELVKRLALDHLPEAPPPVEGGLDARLRQWQEQDGKPLTPDVPARALFARWAKEDASMTDAERAAEDQLWDQFQKSLNATRASLGMRQL